MQSCNHYHNQHIEQFYLPNISFSSSTVFPQLLALGTTDMFFTILILSFLVFHINRIKQYIFFCI